MHNSMCSVNNGLKMNPWAFSILSCTQIASAKLVPCTALHILSSTMNLENWINKQIGQQKNCVPEPSLWFYNSCYCNFLLRTKTPGGGPRHQTAAPSAFVLAAGSMERVGPALARLSGRDPLVAAESVPCQRPGHPPGPPPGPARSRRASIAPGSPMRAIRGRAP